MTGHLGAEDLGEEMTGNYEEGGQDSWLAEHRSWLSSSGNFILMYFFMLLFFGVPLMYMEMIMGKCLRMDSIQVWKQLVPWLGGIGYASVLVSESPARGIPAPPLRSPGSLCPPSPPPFRPTVSTPRCASW